VKVINQQRIPRDIHDLPVGFVPAGPAHTLVCNGQTYTADEKGWFTVPHDIGTMLVAQGWLNEESWGMPSFDPEL